MTSGHARTVAIKRGSFARYERERPERALCRCGHIARIHEPQCYGYVRDPEPISNGSHDEHGFALDWTPGELCECREFSVGVPG